MRKEDQIRKATEFVYTTAAQIQQFKDLWAAELLRRAGDRLVEAEFARPEARDPLFDAAEELISKAASETILGGGLCRTARNYVRLIRHGVEV